MLTPLVISRDTVLILVVNDLLSSNNISLYIYTIYIAYVFSCLMYHEARVKYAYLYTIRISGVSELSTRNKT